VADGQDPTGQSYPFKSGYQVPEIVTVAVKRLDEALHHHQWFVRNFERQERAYKGILHATAQAARWRHTMHPPYAFNMIETIVANTVEMGLGFQWQPQPKPGLSTQDAQALMAQTSVVRDLIRHEEMFDHMDAKQRPLFLCDSIGGRGVGKTYWNWSQESVKRQGVVMTTIHGPNDEVLGQVPIITEVEAEEVIYDNSTTEIIDPRDFIMHESAKALQPREPGGAQYCFQRSWYSMEQLKHLESIGFLTNVDYLSETRDQSSEYNNREKELWRINRTKDLIEVIEYWYYYNGAVWRMIFGNRQVQLRAPEKNPFWHGKYPFFIASSAPNLFSTVGTSDMELISQLQEMIWELMNQRLDNLELVNNAIMLIRQDVDDYEAFEYYPGAQWPVDDPKQVVPLTPPYQVATISLEAEELLKGDLQNVSSAVPLAGGNDSGATTAQTATGASLIMSAAQKRLTAKKWQAQLGLIDEAQLRLSNCQQFLNGNRLLHTLGPNGKLIFTEISPIDVQGDFIAMLKAVNESDNRQERRAEAQSLLQLLQGVYPMSYASGQPIDMHAVVMYVLEQWGLETEGEAFFLPPTTPDPQTTALLFGDAPRTQVRLTGALAAGSEQGAETGQGELGSPPAPGGGNNLGTTAATATDAASPSATGGLSMSPAVMLQRAQALAGSAKGRVG
jgi:hypothetical protein